MTATAQIVLGASMLAFGIAYSLWKRSVQQREGSRWRHASGSPSEDGTMVFEDEDGNQISVPDGEDPLTALFAAETERLKAKGIEVAHVDPLDGVPFYIKIPEAISPLERGEKCEDPLWDELEKSELGEITGGGTGIAPRDKIEYCGIDVVVTDLEAGLATMRNVLIRQGAPEATVLIQLEPEEIEHPLHR